MQNRRTFLGGLALVAMSGGLARASAPARRMIIHKDPNCGCCAAWTAHVRAAGFETQIVETNALDRVKARLRVPQSLASCHTAEIDGYVIEGHVPAADIVRLLKERPKGRGLAVPGMPVNSPGMEVPGAPEERYEVVLFGEGTQTTFGVWTGGRRV